MARDHFKTSIVYKLLKASNEDRLVLFQSIPVERQGFILLRLSKRIQQFLLGQLRNDEIAAFLNHLDPDDATDALQNLDRRRRKLIVTSLDSHIRDKVAFLLRFNPESAAGLMNVDYIKVDTGATFGEISRLITKYEKQHRKFPTILVHRGGTLVGELPGHVLALENKSRPPVSYIKKVPTVQAGVDDELVIDVFKRHPRNKVVVLDKDEKILGVIHSSDMFRVLEEELGQNLYDFAGVSEEESVNDSVFLKVKYRYKWLIINVGTAFLAASVVGLFKGTIEKYVFLAAYMPIVAGMGGNAGTQTLAVMVRGIALREIELRTGIRAIFHEMATGLVNGLILGLIISSIATLLNHTPVLGMVVGASLVINLMIAGLFGALVPLIMKSLGKDPATSAGIFITTATDVCGFFTFLGLATLVLK